MKPGTPAQPVLAPKPVVPAPTPTPVATAAVDPPKQTAPKAQATSQTPTPEPRNVSSKPPPIALGPHFQKKHEQSAETTKSAPPKIHEVTTTTPVPATAVPKITTTPTAPAPVTAKSRPPAAFGPHFQKKHEQEVQPTTKTVVSKEQEQATAPTTPVPVIPPATPKPRPPVAFGPHFQARHEQEVRQEQVKNIVHNEESVDNIEQTLEQKEEEQKKRLIYPVGWTKQKILDTVSNVLFVYLSDIGRFQLQITNPEIKSVVLSPQLCYVLGYEETDEGVFDKQVAKYPCDLKGGISHFCIYAPGLIDDVIVGDQMTSLLRIVSVSGKPGEVVERIYDSVLFSKVQPREVREISIQVRNMEGRLLPLQQGILVVTLLFKKAIVF